MHLEMLKMTQHHYEDGPAEQVPGDTTTMMLDKFWVDHVFGKLLGGQPHHDGGVTGKVPGGLRHHMTFNW